MRYFVRITPANLCYALWLSLQGPVAVWKIQVPERLARRFARVRPYRIFSRDEWLLAHDRAFDLWKTHALPALVARHRHVVRLGGREVDFSRNVWQLLGMEVEALSLFVSMLEKERSGGRAPPEIVEPRIAAAFGRSGLQALFPGTRIVPSAANRVLEQLHEWLVSAAYLAEQLGHLFASLIERRRQAGPRAVAWLGVSPVESPDGDDRLNFAWAAQYGRLAARDVLYFLRHAPSPAQKTYLDAHGIDYLEPARTFGILPMTTRLGVAGRVIGGFIAALARPAAVAPALARLLCRAPYWDAAFPALGTTTYVTTTSYSWPERAELAVASARGIRTIIWAYSANSLTFTVEDPSFRDLGVARSIVIASEFWVWNRAYAEWLARRQVDTPGPTCAIRVVGPLMCGDARLLALGSAAARRRLRLPPDGVCIGAFDMPPITDAWRDRFGGGPPMVDTETYIEFWKVLERVVTQVPGSYVMVKLKRDFTHAYREFPEFLHALLDENGEHVRSGRVRRVDVNVDPYLPIAACDIAIGIAYTSPVLAARTAGKPGYYLDPLKRANLPSHPDFRRVTLHTEAEVVDAVLRLRGDGLVPLVPAEAITPPPPTVPLGA